MTFIETWSNSTGILLKQDIVGYPLIITITIFVNVVQQKVFKKKKLMFFYFIIFPLVIISDLIGTYKPIEKSGFGVPIWCILFGSLFRVIFDLTKKIHCVEIYTLQKSLIPYESTIKISIIILAMDWSNLSTYFAKSLVIAWVESSIMIIIISLIGIKLIDHNTSLIAAFGIALCGPFTSTLIANIVNFNINILHRITTVMTLSVVPSIFSLPLISNSLNLTSAGEGAWIGGSIDSIGAALAGGNLGGMYVLQNTILIKILQMILISPLCLLINVLFVRKHQYIILWHTFPKFVFGFIITSTIVTILPEDIKELVITNCFSVSQWFLEVGFVMMGFDINFKILTHLKRDWRIFTLYFIGKIIDTSVVLGISYLLYELK